MDYYSTHYRSGEEIRSGDLIELAGEAGEVVFVLTDDALPPEWRASEEWLRRTYGEGFMLKLARLGYVFQRESNEDLVMCKRRGDARSSGA